MSVKWEEVKKPLFRPFLPQWTWKTSETWTGHSRYRQTKAAKALSHDTVLLGNQKESEIATAIEVYGRGCGCGRDGKGVGVNGIGFEYTACDVTRKKTFSCPCLKDRGKEILKGRVSAEISVLEKSRWQLPELARELTCRAEIRAMRRGVHTTRWFSPY